MGNHYRNTMEQNTQHRLPDGSYQALGNWYRYIQVEGDTGVARTADGNSHQFHIKLGNFGAADPDIVKSTGQEVYNVEFSYNIVRTFTELGVISKDGLTITVKGGMGIFELKLMTEEEKAVLEDEGDPIEAPPGPYKIQPDKHGKFLWISGPPGLGKSTSAQMLGRNAGYVYYEADCFAGCRNPYLPLEVEEPTLAQLLQKPLRGEGLEERRQICTKLNTILREVVTQEAELDMEVAKEFYGAMCEDIRKERTRIGGDWAIAACVLKKELRDFIRSSLGPDLVFVVLNMDLEEVRQRMMTRHKGSVGTVEMLLKFHTMCETATDDEDNTVEIVITTDMTREDVTTKILDMVK